MGDKWCLLNLSTGEVLAEEVELALTPWRRTLGLMGRREYPPHKVLWIEPCGSIHTCFMRFPIDVVFLDGEGKVRKVVRHLLPWRMTWCWGAKVTLEWRSPGLSPHIEVGHHLGRRRSNGN